jgi:hypothetical protein
MMDFFNNVERNDARLSHLRTVLAQLPDSIPLGNSEYNFEHYAPDPDKVELYGSTEAALNNALEVTFAPEVRRTSLRHAHLNFKNVGQVLLQSSMSLQLPSISFRILRCFKNGLVIYGGPQYITISVQTNQ